MDTQTTDKSKIIHLATTDIEVVKMVKEMFPEHTLFTADVELYNKITAHYVEKSINWTQQQSVEEARKDPKEIEKVMTVCNSLKKVFTDNFFILSDLVKCTDLNYKEAEEAISLLYAFGYLQREKRAGNGKVTKQVSKYKYKIVDEPKDKILYLKSVVKGQENNIIEINSLIETIAMQHNLTTDGDPKEEAHKKEETFNTATDEGQDIGKADDDKDSIEKKPAKEEVLEKSEDN